MPPKEHVPSFPRTPSQPPQATLPIPPQPAPTGGRLVPRAGTDRLQRRPNWPRGATAGPGCSPGDCYRTVARPRDREARGLCPIQRHWWPTTDLNWPGLAWLTCGHGRRSWARKHFPTPALPSSVSARTRGTSIWPLMLDRSAVDTSTKTSSGSGYLLTEGTSWLTPAATFTTTRQHPSASI